MPADRLEAIEQQIRTLQNEVQSLRRELGQTKQQLRESQSEARRARDQARRAQAAASHAQQQVEARIEAAPPPAPVAIHAPPPPPAPPPGPHVTQTAKNRFGLESADGRNSISLMGQLHFDTGDYLDYNPQSKFASVQNLHSGVNARRARLGVTGKFLGDWNYTLLYDFGGPSDGLPPTPGSPKSGIVNAYVTYNGLARAPVPLVFDVGYQKTLFTLEGANSSNDIMFVERPSAQVIASSFFAGNYRSALGVRSFDKDYWAGVYVTGPRSGARHDVGEEMGAFGRATYQLVDRPDATVHLGGDIGGLVKPPSSAAGVPTITLGDRPELRVDPTVILTTGALGTAANPVRDAASYGVEVAAGYRNLFLQGEYYHILVDRQGLATNGFDGGYVEASWTLTGEHRTYIPALSAYSGITPRHPFSPWDHEFGLGAFELVGRVSTISLNDNFTPGVPPGKTNAVGGGTQTVYGVGLNWYANANIRFMFDYLHGSINKRFSTAADGGIAKTPLGTPVGGNFDAVVARTQFAF